MAFIHCPACASQAPPQLLEDLSAHAYVNYWRCPDCRHVWVASKENDEVLRHVTTPLPKRPPKKS